MREHLRSVILDCPRCGLPMELVQDRIWHRLLGYFVTEQVIPLCDCHQERKVTK